jgi:hypothetical protein
MYRYSLVLVVLGQNQLALYLRWLLLKLLAVVGAVEQELHLQPQLSLKVEQVGVVEHGLEVSLTLLI